MLLDFRKLKKLVLVGLFLIGQSMMSQSALACDAAPEAPELPNVETAVVAEMVKAQKSVKRFMADANKYLKCKISDRKHDAMVDKMEKLGKKFNKLVKEYKASKKK